MLPEFYDGLNLPEGLHECSIDEVERRFGGTNTRVRLCGILRRLIARGRDCNFRRVVLFGSFVSSGNHPGDVDLFWVLPPGTETNNLALRCRELLDSANSHQALGCDVFWCFDDDEEVQRMTALWSLDREGRKKGLVVIDLQK